MVDLGSGLAERGHTVTLVACPGSAVSERATEAGLTVEPVQIRGLLDPRSLIGLRRAVSQRRPDLVLANMEKPVRMLSLVGGLRGRPVVRRLGMSTSFPDAWRFRHVYRTIVDVLVVNARGTQEVLARDNPWIPSEKVLIIPSAVDIEALDAIDRADARRRLRDLAGVSDDRPVVVAVGRLARQKRPDVLIGALTLLGESVQAVWIGEGPWRAEIEVEVARTGARLHLAGFRADAAELMAGADALVQPSQSEGMPHAVLEAMALGVPVVGSRVSGIIELLDGGRGRMVEVGEPAELAAAVDSVFTQPEETARMAEAARARVEADHARPVMLDRYETLFRSLLERSRP